MIPIFYGQVKEGKLYFTSREKFDLYVGSLSGKVEVIVKKYRKTRSTKQNSYYWACLKLIGDTIGEEPEELHATFKAMFLVDRSKKIPIVRSTAKLTSIQFTEYIEKIARLVAKFNIVLPDPNSYYSEEINY